MYLLILASVIEAVALFNGYYTLAFLFIVLYLLKYVYDLGLSSSIKFYKGKSPNCDVFYLREDKAEPVKQIKQLENLIDKFKLDRNIHSSFIITYKPFENQCQKIVGIRREILDEIKPTENDQKESKEFMDYLKENNFKIGKLPDIICLIATFPNLLKFSLKIGLYKFNSSVRSNLKDESFLKIYGVKESNPSFINLVYHKNEIKFYVPLKTNEKFMKLL